MEISCLRSARIVLASGSPRRAELLRAAGIDFDIIPANVDESVAAGESPHDYVSRLASTKAVAVNEVHPDRIVLAADTAVVVDSHILGKPVDSEDARRMLRLISGRAHDVVTGVAIRRPDLPPTASVARTTVAFARLSQAEIDWYIATGEPMDKAGAYAVQGLASRFVTGINGSYSNVVGLPVSLVYHMLFNSAAP